MSGVKRGVYFYNRENKKTMSENTQNTDIYKVEEVKLHFKYNLKYSERPTLSSSKDTFEVLCKVWDYSQIDYKESFKTILLNRANKVIGVCNISEGGTSATITDIKHILQSAILSNASAIMVAHNHPSGNTTPSEHDKRITQQIKQACKIVDIILMDHIIITSEAYYSFADNAEI